MHRMLWIMLLAGCGPDDTLELQTAPLTRPSAPPEAGFDIDDRSTWVSPGVLTGFVSDADQAASTLPITVESVLDGVLWTGNADGLGEWAWQGELSFGENPLLLTTEDREGNTTEVSLLLDVRPNAAPDCRILAPAPDQVVVVRTDVSFAATTSDADGDELTVLWRSSIEGALGEGNTFVRRFRQPGNHLVNIEVIDEVGASCTDEIRVIVRE